MVHELRLDGLLLVGTVQLRSVPFNKDAEKVNTHKDA
jgi:hypothetical protein